MPDDVPGPPSVSVTADGSQMSRLIKLAEDIADARARLAILEQQSQSRIQSEDARFAGLQQQVEHIGDRLDQQDQMAASSQQQLKSQLGTLQQQQAQLIGAEAERARLLLEADQTRARLAAAADAAAQQRHRDTVSRLRRVLAGVALFVASSTWPLLAGLPVRTRLLVLAAGIGLAVLWALSEYVRSLRRPSRAP